LKHFFSFWNKDANSDNYYPKNDSKISLEWQELRLLVDELPEIAKSVKKIMGEEAIREQEEYEEMTKAQGEMLKKRQYNNWGGRGGGYGFNRGRR